MKIVGHAIGLIACLGLVACHHATIRTGAAPGDTEIHKPWATSLIYGIVPPGDIETADDCPNGVAIVETQRSFLNGLVGLLTLGIYTPMEIKVTCAATSGGEDQDGAVELKVPEDGTDQEVAATFQRAADLSLKEGRPVYVRF